jgi:phosphoribosylformimino-5-aminoimidazole carboxamide ribotide isomerase
MSDFQVIPAIELRGGLGLRYESIGMGTRANRVDPLSLAKQYVEAGAPVLHVYNLDGPFIVGGAEHQGSVLAGAERNLTVVGEIARAFQVPVQLSGGVRDIESFKVLVQLGVTRAAIGSAAMRNPAMVREAVQANPEALVVFVDVNNGAVVGQEWVQGSNVSVGDVAQELSAAGVKRIIYQDVAADASGAGPRVQDAASVGALGIEVLVTGGVQTLEHIRGVAAVKGVSGVIVGKPLSMGTFTYEQALEAAAQGVAERK